MTEEARLVNGEQNFQSIPAARTAHRELIQMRRADGFSEEFYSQARLFVVKGVSMGAILDDLQDRQELQTMLDYWDNYLATHDQERPDSTLADYDPALAPELPEHVRPFVGLNTFSEENANYFYGRQNLTDQLLEHLSNHRFLAIVGSSGSGKSSLVLAGLLPHLKQGKINNSAEWSYYERIVPGANPVRNLVITISMNDQLTEPVDLRHYLDKKNPKGAVLIIDQFEEIFTLSQGKNEWTLYLDSLVELIENGNGLHTIILTMRTDFESFVVGHEGFNELFGKHTFRMTPLTSAELRQAIERPADAVGLKFETGVVERLIQDVVGEPAALPLLQFTLLKLWEAREKNRITLDAYERLGGGRLALARSADKLYEGLLTEDQFTARRLLLLMVRPGEGLEVTNKRIRLTDIYQSGEAEDRVDRVLEKLLDGHLLKLTEGKTEADTQVEVAHEALVRNWPKLVEWIDEARMELRRRQRLTSAAEQWSVGENEDLLWRGEQLQEAEQYNGLNELEQRFVAASMKMQTILKAREKEARIQEQELHTQKRINRVLRWAAVIIVSLLIVSMIFAYQSRTNATLAITREEEALSAQVTSEFNASLATTREAEALSAQATSEFNASLATTREAEALSAQATSEFNVILATTSEAEVVNARETEVSARATSDYNVAYAREISSNFATSEARQTIESSDVQATTDPTRVEVIIESTPASRVRLFSLPTNSYSVEMVEIPAGVFIFGSVTEGESESIELDSYWIDVTEVTNEQFREFAEQMEYETTAEIRGFGWANTGGSQVEISPASWKAPNTQIDSIEDRMDHPVVQVSLYDAAAFCAWRDARLPTEEEWEKAARGVNGEQYPWGNDEEKSLLLSGKTSNYCDAQCPLGRGSVFVDGSDYTNSVMSYPDGQSPYGVYEMIGNVWEWTSTPDEASASQNVIRGGSYYTLFNDMSVTRWVSVGQGYRADDLGFRCVVSEP